MKPTKGILQNVRPHDIPEGYYFFGKNGIQHDTVGAVENEKGTSIEPTTIPGTHIGTVEIDKDKAIVFSLDQGVSKIGYYDYPTSTWTKILDDTDLDAPMGFSLDHYITGEFQRNYKNEVITVFTDKTVFPKILNCDNPDATTLDELRLFLQATAPTMVTTVVQGGSLEKGAYFVGVKYLLNDGSETDLVALSTAKIVSSPTSSTITDKAISIQLTNLDQKYDQVQLFFVSRIGGDYKAYEGPKLEIATTLNYVYTGEELFQATTLEDLLIPSPVYSKVGTIGQLNDALYIADLEKEPELNLQKYANLVKLRVKSELIDVIPATPEHVDGTKRSLMHQEVYAAYIRFRRTAGGWTKAFHVPGNTPSSADLITTGNTHEIDLGARVFQTRDTNRNIVGTSCDTGIWQNSNELYPDLEDFDSSAIGGRNLRNQKVLHHRMPSIAFCKENFYPGVAEYGRTKLDVLSLEVSNVTLPPELVGKIDGYEILIAKRTLANSTVVGQGLVLLQSQIKGYIGTNLNYVSTGGNWHSMTVAGAGTSGSADFQHHLALQVTGRSLAGSTAGTPQTEKPGARIRIHPFDMLFSQPAVTPSYLSAQLKYRKNGINAEATGYMEDGEIDDVRVPIIMVIDYSKATTVSVPNITHRVRVLEEAKYLPNNVVASEYRNDNIETTYVAKMKWIGPDSDITNNQLPIDVAFSTVNKNQFQRPAQRPTHEETYLANLMDIKPDLYQTFYSQRLIGSGVFIPISTAVGSVYAGDTFISEYSYHTYGWFDGENHPGDDAPNPATDGGYKIVRRCICEAAANIALRYEVSGNIYSRWWPHNTLVPQPTAPDGYLYAFDRNFDPNQFGYTRDLNTLNELANVQPFNPFAEDITEFPFRIHRGGKLPRQGKLRSWRNFLPLDYYEIQKNLGRIIRVLGKDDRLLIHTENALLQTQDKTKLEGDVLSVTLGTGDIFQFEPQEVLSAKQGYAGTQHELAAIDTPLGYVFVDAKQGQIFLFKGGLKLINEGLNTFFRKYIKEEFDSRHNNPYTGNGITIGYDPDYKRILLTVRNSVIGVGIENFVPNYQETAEFYATLTDGVSVVYNDGRYQVFIGETDCPANPSEFSIACEEFDVNINVKQTVGTVIANVTVTNPLNVPLTFAITAGDTTDNFSINSTTGEIRIESATGLSDGDTRTLTVTATDNYGNVETCDIVLDILAPEGRAPIANNEEVFVNVGTPAATIVASISGSSPEGNPVNIYLDPENVEHPFELANVNTANVTADLKVKAGETIAYDTTIAWELGIILEDTVTSLATRLVLTIQVVPASTAGNAIIQMDTCATGATIVSIKDQADVDIPLADGEAGTFPLGPGEALALAVPAGTTQLKIVTGGSETWTRIVVKDSQGTETCQTLIALDTTYDFTINSLGTGQIIVSILCDEACAV